MKRIVAFIVCLCLMLSTSGCLFITIPSIEIPKLPIFPTKPQPTGSIPFTYTLTDEDVDAFYRLLEASEKLALADATPGRDRRAFCTRLSQFAQNMPCTSIVSVFGFIISVIRYL